MLCNLVAFSFECMGDLISHISIQKVYFLHESITQSNSEPVTVDLTTVPKAELAYKSIGVFRIFPARNVFEKNYIFGQKMHFFACFLIFLSL